MEEPIGYVALKDFPPAVVRRQIRRPLSYFAMAMDNLRKKIRLEKLNKALGEKADRDPLTGLFNRYGFTEHALPVKEYVLEAGGLLEFLFIDVDDMRKINDEFGHGAGDQALMTLSKAMMDLAYKNKYNEKNFIAMRFGGDEFTVLCEKKDESFAALIKKEVGKMNMLRQYPFDIKVSIGVLEISPIDDFTADQMLKIADDRMYEEKQKKKNGDK
jgi:diguanylate cyclase (GGDEF)-like protein